MAKEKYNWNFCSLGGVTRVLVDKGSDIENLDRLNEKLWTVLSCPTQNLEFDKKTLAVLDRDSDGMITVKEVVQASKWLTAVLKDSNLILQGNDSLTLDQISDTTPEGKELAHVAQRILENTGKSTTDTLTLEDAQNAESVFIDKFYYGAGAVDGFFAQCKALSDWAKSKPSDLPYEDTPKVYELYNRLKPKVEDFFLRCRLICFDEQTKDTLDVSVDEVAKLSADNLSARKDEIASYPIARPDKQAKIPLDAVNPVWAGDFSQFVALAGIKEYLDEAKWKKVGESLSVYAKWVEAHPVTQVEGLGLQKIDEILAENSINSDDDVKVADATLSRRLKGLNIVDDFIHLYRDFYHFLCNFLNFTDFYSPESKRKAMFNAGKLYIDQRCCHLCIRVNNMAGHANMAALGGMFLIYTSCHCEKLQKTMDVVSVLTEGAIKNIRVGKNGLFYDNEGNEYLATVTKVVDNPVSVAQAFWAPYRKFVNFISEKIVKDVQDKESQVDVVAAVAPSNFDIAKFAGIFAAIGMGLGYIGAALTKVVDEAAANPLGFLLVLAMIILSISGSSCILAAIKIHRRNLGPILNANNWAINSLVIINSIFGATLTSVAAYPMLKKVKDPYLDKSLPVWAKILIALAIVAVAALVVYGIRTGTIPFFENLLQKTSSGIE